MGHNNNNKSKTHSSQKGQYWYLLFYIYLFYNVGITFYWHVCFSLTSCDDRINGQSGWNGWAFLNKPKTKPSLFILCLKCYTRGPDLWQITEMGMRTCISTPAVLPDVFFRVNITVTVSGSPTNPQELIKRWVQVSHDCIFSTNFTWCQSKVKILSSS